MDSLQPRRINTERMSVSEVAAINREPLITQKIPFTYEDGKKTETFVIHPERIGFGGESEVYAATRASDGERVAAKVYLEISVDERTIKLHDELCSFLYAHSDIAKYHLMPLLAHGVIHLTTDEDIPYAKFVEFMPLLRKDQHLDLRKPYTVTELRKNLLPQLLIAIRTMHDEDWLHRDIKPENLFMIDGSLVLGDYGVACKLLPDVNAIRATTRHGGTPGYVAPEVTTGYATKASDCYSLGSTLVTLRLGHHYSQHGNMGGHFGPALHNLNQHLSQNTLPFSLGNDQLEAVVKGLLQVDVSQRYTLDDVNEYCEKDGWIPRTIRHATILNANFNQRRYNDKESLAAAMANAWSAAKRYLYQGGVNNSSFVRNIDDLDGLGQIALDIIEKTTREQEDVGLTRLLYEMHPALGICWQGRIYPSYPSIAAALEQGGAEQDAALALVQSGVLAWVSQRNGHPESNIQVLEEIKDHLSSERTREAARWMAVFIFSGQQAKGAELHDTMDHWFAALKGGKDDPHQRMLRVPENMRQLAWLRLRGACDIWPLLAKLSTDPIKRLVTIYRFFEAHCQQKQMVRSDYIAFGPYAHLSWWQKHLSLYVFNGKQATALRNHVQSLRLDDRLPIAQLNEIFAKLDEELSGFHQLFQGNMVLAVLGYTLGKPIISTHSDAFFEGERLGKKVPLGFAHSMKTDRSRS